MKSDNVPFSSAEFDRFATEFNIQFKFSSPRYPQSNGLAEKAVGIAKNILKRCYEANEVDQFQYRILEYNTTPVASIGLTPSELFFGRLVKTKLPVSGSLLVRNNIVESKIKKTIEKKKERQKYYYDRSAKSLPVLNEGDLVIFKKNSKEWNYGKIIGNVNGSSYIIRDGLDNFFRRNRRFIAKTMNSDFNASELLFEENIKRDCNDPNKFKEIRIVPPAGGNNAAHENNCEANEPELPVEIDLNGSASTDEYETAGSDGSGTDSENEISMHEPVLMDPYRTRSGRTIRAPQRYGWN